MLKGPREVFGARTVCRMLLLGVPLAIFFGGHCHSFADLLVLIFSFLVACCLAYMFGAASIPYDSDETHVPKRDWHKSSLQSNAFGISLMMLAITTGSVAYFFEHHFGTLQEAITASASSALTLLIVAPCVLIETKAESRDGRVAMRKAFQVLWAVQFCFYVSFITPHLKSGDLTISIVASVALTGITVPIAQAIYSNIVKCWEVQKSVTSSLVNNR